MENQQKKHRAFLSVFEKEGITEFARGLVEIGWEIEASGGTCKHLRATGLPCLDIADRVGEPILGHRVVTLSREFHAGLLAQESGEDRAELERRGIPWIDLVCCDLYPLKAEIANSEATRESVIEKTDIGGPTMIRAAAKGRRIVVCDPADRASVLGWLERLSKMRAGTASLLEEEEDAWWKYRGELCAKAERVVADYCLASARFHSSGEIDGMVGTEVLVPKYGENAPQTPAGLYKVDDGDPLALHRFQPVAGQPPSYNNLCDLDRMLQTATHIAASAAGVVGFIAIAVKHGNPCGAAYDETYRFGSDKDQESVLRKMVDGDHRAIFGGLVMTNFILSEAAADILLTHGMKEGRRLLDGIVAPGFSPVAIGMLKRKGDKCRFIMNPALRNLSLDRRDRFRYVRGGFLMQPNYAFVPEWEKLALSAEDVQDVKLAWAIGCTSNSNTITLVKDGMLIGNGVGQQDRVGCCELAIKRARDAGHSTFGAVAYSDSFFPFEDGPKVLIEAGVRAIFATSGSVRDEVVRKTCDDAGVRFYTLPDAEARGFFGH